MLLIENKTDIIKKLDDYPVFKLFIKYAILEDNYDLYVDHLPNPELIIMHVPPAFIFYGKPKDSEKESIQSIVQKGAWIISPNQRWDEYLLKTFNQCIRSFERTSFDESFLDLSHLKSLGKPLPDGLKIVEIDEKYVNQWMIKSQITDKFFVSKPFLKYGFGLCLIDQNDVVQGFALTNYPLDGGDEIEVSYRIGYDDFQDYRRKGIGTTLVTMFLAMAINKGYKPIWDAATDVSAHIAKKIGYIEKRKWFMYHIEC